MRVSQPFSRLLAVVLAVLAVFAAAGCDTDEDVVDPAQPLLPRSALYVCNQGSATITVLSTETNEVAATLDLRDYDFPGAPDAAALANAKPHHVVVEPDGSAFYVSLIGLDQVAKFNRRAELVGTVPFEAPGMLALAPGGRLYAGHTMSIVDVPPTVAVIQRTSMTLAGDPLEVGIQRPHGLGVLPESNVVYAGSLSENALAAIDAETRVVGVTRQAAEPLQRYIHFAAAPGGERVYATGQTAGQVRVFDTSEPASPRVAATVDVGPAPWHPSLSEDGATLYFGNKGANTVTVLDTETLQTEVLTGEGLAQPHGSALSPDGQYLYVSNTNQNGTYAPAGANGTVVVIDTGTRTIVDVIEVGENPTGLGTPGA